jgi:RNA polymerase sigma-70 factor, ECF subfamily
MLQTESRSGDVDIARDRELVVRAQDGDEGAFEALYLQYYDRLYRYCLRRLENRTEAEDAAQEAFARAWKALPNLAGERRFYPWLTVIAANLCVDLARRNSRSSPVAQPELDLLAPAVNGEQELLVDRRGERDMLSRALGNLSARHQEVLELREGRSWTYQQIAAYSGVEVSTIETLLFRARRSLRQEFMQLARAEGALGVVLAPLFFARRTMARIASSLRAWATVAKGTAAGMLLPSGSALGGVAVAAFATTALATASIATAAAAPLTTPTRIEASAVALRTSSAVTHIGGTRVGGAAAPMASTRHSFVSGSAARSRSTGTSGGAALSSGAAAAGTAAQHHSRPSLPVTGISGAGATPGGSGRRAGGTPAGPHGHNPGVAVTGLVTTGVGAPNHVVTGIVTPAVGAAKHLVTGIVTTGVGAAQHVVTDVRKIVPQILATIPAPRVVKVAKVVETIIPKVPVPKVPVPKVPVPKVPVPKVPLAKAPVPKLPVPKVPVPKIPVPKLPKVRVPHVPTLPHL